MIVLIFGLITEVIIITLFVVLLVLYRKAVTKEENSTQQEQLDAEKEKEQKSEVIELPNEEKSDNESVAVLDKDAPKKALITSDKIEDPGRYSFNANIRKLLSGNDNIWVQLHPENIYKLPINVVMKQEDKKGIQGKKQSKQTSKHVGINASYNKNSPMLSRFKINNIANIKGDFPARLTRKKDTDKQSQKSKETKPIKVFAKKQ